VFDPLVAQAGLKRIGSRSGDSLSRSSCDDPGEALVLAFSDAGKP
jgi:hypothetical protein